MRLDMSKPDETVMDSGGAGDGDSLQLHHQIQISDSSLPPRKRARVAQGKPNDAEATDNAETLESGAPPTDNNAKSGDAATATARAISADNSTKNGAPDENDHSSKSGAPDENDHSSKNGAPDENAPPGDSAPQPKETPKGHAWRTHRGDPIQNPHENDVLMGRGKRFSDHKGNIKFREFIREKKASYTLSWKYVANSQVIAL
jgi:hypothetical protein